MKKYYYLSDYFVIHEGDKNTLIFIGTKGEENYLEAIMDPGYNEDLNAYLALGSKDPISQEEFYCKLELEKIEKVKKAKEAKKLAESTIPHSDYIPF